MDNEVVASYTKFLANGPIIIRVQSLLGYDYCILTKNKVLIRLKCDTILEAVLFLIDVSIFKRILNDCFSHKNFNDGVQKYINVC